MSLGCSLVVAAVILGQVWFPGDWIYALFFVMPLVWILMVCIPLFPIVGAFEYYKWRKLKNQIVAGGIEPDFYFRGRLIIDLTHQEIILNCKHRKPLDSVSMVQWGRDSNLYSSIKFYLGHNERPVKVRGSHERIPEDYNRMMIFLRQNCPRWANS